NFLIAGGKHPDSLCMNLIVDGKVHRTVTGDQTNVFKWNGWNVSDLIGKKAQLTIVDAITDSTQDRKSTRLNSSHVKISYAVFCYAHRRHLPSFPTRRSSDLNFLIAGGKHPDSLCMNLIVDGKVHRTVTGDQTNVFKWNGWNVSDLIGKKAQLTIVDAISDSTHGAIAVDHIVFSNELMNHQLEHALWLDYGNDYYATRTWRNYDDTNTHGDTVFAIG